MQATLEDFFKALRGSDLEVSLNAQIDAACATSLVGWSDREVLKAALGSTLAKTLPERTIFDETFERFFRFDAFGTGGTVGAADGPAPRTQEPGAPSPEESGRGSGGPGGCRGGSGQSLSQLLLSGDSAALSRRLQQAARDVGLTEIWFFTQKGQYTQRIQQAMGLETLEREIRDARRQALAPHRLQELERARRRLFEEVRDFVERRLSMYGTAPTRELHDEFLQSQRLANVDRRDFLRMHELVRRIARRLAERHARRRRRERRGQLDFRRTQRANAAYGGVLFETHWRTTRIERPRVLAICDVSGSVRQYARFLLLFLYSLDELLSDVRSFAFTDHLVEVSATFESLPVERAVDHVMQAVGGSGTDYGRMLLDLDEQLMHRIDHRTTVLVLGDARNNRGHPRTEILKALHGRARRVVWLNPEPRSFWGLGDSEMKRYAPYCHIARECSTLRHLERALDELLRAGSATA